MRAVPAIRRLRLVATAMGAVACLGCAGSSASPGPPPQLARGIAFERVASGLTDPVYLTAPPGDSRLFVVEQPGRIRIVREGRLIARPFLDLTREVGYGGERGLLSIAFHPRYRENRSFFVNFTDRDGNTRVERFQVGADPDVADPGSRHLILEVEQPYANHNGGHILFGPDGMLYVGMGDGGGAGDPHGNGQNRATLLGALLRLDVDHGNPYSIPADNPYARSREFRREIWAYGLRNPWRFAFDEGQGLLYIADVGQNRWEEIDVVPSRAAGLNYGWNRMEGAHCFRASNCDLTGLVLPAVEYGHGDGCSVTGGFVYRGSAIPELVGHYFYADYCQGWVRSFRWAKGQVLDHRQWELARPGQILSFGLDAAGELYLLTADGSVSRLVPSRPR